MNSVEDRVRAALSGAGHVAEQEIQSAPPLRLPPGHAGSRSRPRSARRRWITWGAPVTAVAAVVALAVSMVLVNGTPNAGVVPVIPSASGTQGAPVGPGGSPRYYAALSSTDGGLVIGDSAAGTVLAKVAPPVQRNVKTFFRTISAAEDDTTFVIMAETYSDSAFDSKVPDAVDKATVTASWFEVRLAPGTPNPARLTALPVKPKVSPGAGAGQTVSSAVSGSGTELAVTSRTATGGFALQVFSVATGQLLHEWTTSDPSLSVASHGLSQGLAGQPSVTWLNGDQKLALETASATPQSKSTHPFLGFGAQDIVRELTVAGPSTGDLIADSKVVWNVQTWEYPASLLQACAGNHGAHFISAGGTALGCLAVTGPDTNPNLSFLTYPLSPQTATAAKGTLAYEVAHMHQKEVSTQQIMWISPSGSAVIGAWTIYAKGTLEDSANGLHIGVLSHGTLTPLKFPAGFDLLANVATLTW